MGILTEKVENLNQQLSQKDSQLAECRQTIENMVRCALFDVISLTCFCIWDTFKS